MPEPEAIAEIVDRAEDYGRDALGREPPDPLRFRRLVAEAVFRKLRRRRGSPVRGR